MPNYLYRCSCCQERQELYIPADERTDTRPCPCGQVAEQLLFDDEKDPEDRAPAMLVRGNQRPIKLDWTDMPLGWERGNGNAKKQEERYDEVVNETKKRALAVDKQAIKNGIRHIATVPREMHRLRSKQYGKSYLDPASQSTAELKGKLKSDGLLFKD